MLQEPSAAGTERCRNRVSRRHPRSTSAARTGAPALVVQCGLLKAEEGRNCRWRREERLGGATAGVSWRQRRRRRRARQGWRASEARRQRLQHASEPRSDDREEHRAPCQSAEWDSPIGGRLRAPDTAWGSQAATLGLTQAPQRSAGPDSVVHTTPGLPRRPTLAGSILMHCRAN